MSFVSTSSRGSSLVAPSFVGPEWGAVSAGFTTGQMWAMKVWVPTAMIFTKIDYRVISASGNLFLAVYDSNLNRVANVPTFAMVQGPKAIPGNLSCPAGTYYIAIQIDNNVATLASGGANMSGNTSGWQTGNTYASGAPATLTLTSGGATVPLLQLVV